jgi:outer membrane lipoprotein carrier protein
MRGQILRASLACVVFLAPIQPLSTWADEPRAAPVTSSGEIPTDCAEKTASKIQSRYETVRDLSARFSQASRLASLGGDAERSERSRGEVVFAKPGKMRWSYEEPSRSLVVSDGSVLWTYDVEAKEAQRFAGGEGFLSGAAVQFLLGEGEILRDFRVMAKQCDVDSAVLELVPWEPAAYEKLELRSDATTGEIRETAVFDLVGNVTRVTFEDIRVNQNPSLRTFEFQPPAGARVIEVAAPAP